MKAYSYLQLSTPTQRMPIAITRQIERTKQYCDGHGMTLEDFEINGLSAFKDSQKKENVLSGFRKSIESGSHLMPCALIVDDTKWITGQDFRVIFQEFTELIRLNVELHTTHDRMVYRAKDFDVFGLVLNIGRVLGRNELSQAMSMRRRKGLK